MQFGVVAVPRGGGRAWAEQVRAWEHEGWTGVLVPDTIWTTSPFPALAAAAAATTSLRLRTWVAAAPLRTEASTVREVRALQELSDGRFELGIGTGRPDAEREAAALGLPWPAPAARIEHLRRVVAAVREQVSPRPPVAVTAAGPRMIEAAAQLVTGPGSADGDRLALALAPTATADDLQEKVDQARAAAGGDVRITFQLAGIGERMSAWLAQQSGLTAHELADRGAVGLLPPSPAEAADVLREWSGRYGIDEVVVAADFTDDVAPVVRLLRS